MKCIKCNAELNDDAAFCSSCGEKQEQITEVVENAVENADVSAEAEICEDSTATESENTAPEGETAPAKRKKKKIKIAPIIISAVLVVILAVGAVIGIPILRDYMLTKELDPVLANKAFQYVEVDSDSVSIKRYTFFPDNKVTIERYNSEDDSKEQYTEYYTAEEKNKLNKVLINTEKNCTLASISISDVNSGQISYISAYPGTFSLLDEETKLPFDEEIKKQTRESESLKKAEEQKKQAEELKQLQKEALNVLLYCEYYPGFLVGELINGVFSEYEIKGALDPDNSDLFILRISGTYYPNPAVKAYTEKGTFVAEVDIKNKGASFDKSVGDNDAILKSFIMYTTSSSSFNPYYMPSW